VPRESFEVRKERAGNIFKRLREVYPDAHCELEYSNPFELLIATILSAQSTDKQVNIVTANLFRKYRSPKDFAAAPIEDLENDLRRIGLFRNKAKNIKACCNDILTRHGGIVPRTMNELRALPGVGRKTANVVLGNAFQINEGIVVDTHVARLSERLGFSRENSPEKVEIDLQKLAPREDWTILSHWLIWHGRRRCGARSPQCNECEIKEFCGFPLVDE
jgi:endonuclease III